MRFQPKDALIGLALTGILVFANALGLFPENPPSNTETTIQTEPATEEEVMVWASRTGEKYHNNPNCCRMIEPHYWPVSKAKRMGYSECLLCYRT